MRQTSGPCGACTRQPSLKSKRRPEASSCVGIAGGGGNQVSDAEPIGLGRGDPRGSGLDPAAASAAAAFLPSPAVVPLNGLVGMGDVIGFGDGANVRIVHNG